MCEVVRRDRWVREEERKVLITYDVDLISDLLDLISVDPTIADGNIKGKIYSFNPDDIVLVTKTLSGALKITAVDKIDPAFISSCLK